MEPPALGSAHHGIRPAEPRLPNKYDLAFLEWFERHGWRLFSSWYGKPEVWSFNDAYCPFKVTRGMITRLEDSHFLERIWPEGVGIGDEYWAVADEATAKIAWSIFWRKAPGAKLPSESRSTGSPPNGEQHHARG